MKTPQITLLFTLAALGGASAESSDMREWRESENRKGEEKRKETWAQWERERENQRKDAEHRQEVSRLEQKAHRANMDSSSSGSQYYEEEKAPKKRIQTAERQRQMQQSQTSGAEEQRLLALVLDEDIKTANASAYQKLQRDSMSEGTRARLLREFRLNLGRQQDQRDRQVQRGNAGRPQQETAQEQPQEETTALAPGSKVEVTPQKFAIWRKAANQGNADAQTLIGACYSNGRYVSKDYVLAYMWYNLASATKPDIAEIRDDVEKMMTPAQIAEGQKLSREWKPQRE